MLAESFQEEGKELVVTDGEQVICVPQQEDVNSRTACNKEEADTRMMLHVAHAAQHGHHQIQVRTVDTDVVVLAVMVVQKTTSWRRNLGSLWDRQELPLHCSP